MNHELQHIGHNIGENVVYALNKTPSNPERLDSLMVAIANGIASIDTDNTALDTLISSIIDDSLTEFGSAGKSAAVEASRDASSIIHTANSTPYLKNIRLGKQMNGMTR